MKRSVLLDTSFFIRLLNDEDPLHKNAKEYYKYFLQNDIELKISTISIAEYCVRGSVEELPLRNLQILVFNFNHAKRTGEFAKIIFEAKNTEKINIKPRAIIPNDAKLFAQTDCDNKTDFFVTSDGRSKNTHSLLLKKVKPNFEIIDIKIPVNERFGLIDFQ